jgi:hypothetical protein
VKQVRTVALSRLSGPSFLALHESEVVKLRQVPAWCRWLFCELVGLSDFRTGAGRASYAQLVALLDFDAMPGRPPAAARVSREQIRRAVEGLESMGLAHRDKQRNTVSGCLFFQVLPRTGLGASEGSSARGSDRGAPARKPRRAAASRPEAPPVSPGVSPAVSGTNSYPLPPSAETCPQAAAPTREQRHAMAAALRAGIAEARSTGGR